MSRRKAFLILCAAALAAAATQAGSFAGSTGSVVVPLKMAHNSGQSGTATLVEKGKTTVVTIVLHPARSRFPGNWEFAHIHRVSCARYAKIQSVNAQFATVTYGLSNLSGGRSQTVASIKLATLRTGTYSINAHQKDSPYLNVACGDIPKG